MSAAGALRKSVDGLVIRFRLTPKSSSDKVEGLVETAEGSALQARVRAAPSDGEANDALVRLVASWVDLPKSRISVIAGHKSRIKSVEISNAPEPLIADIERRLGRLVADNKET